MTHLTIRFLSCLFLSICGSSFQVGWSITVLNTPVSAIREFFNNSYSFQHSEALSEMKWSNLWGLTNALLPLGAAFGALISDHIADYFGRKKGLFITNIVALICYSLSLIAITFNQLSLFILARFLNGFICGMFSTISPMYLIEIAPRKWRGAIGSLHHAAIELGMLSTSIIGLPSILGTANLWPRLFAIALVPVFASFACLPFCLESAKYVYIKRHDRFEAEKILKKLRGSDNEQHIRDELAEYASEQSPLKIQQSVLFKELFTKPTLRRPLVIAIMVQLAQRFTGISFTTYYSTHLFINMGLDANTWAVYATLVINIIATIVTFCCTATIEKLGRRALLITGFSGMTFTSFLLALMPVFFAHTSTLYRYVSVASVVIFVIFYSIGPGPITWMITSELFASNSRSKAMSIANFVNWLTTFFISLAIPILLATIKNYMFILFGVLTVFFMVFIYFKLPETNNKTQEEISAQFQID